jgi:hypothetical protein
MANQFPNVLPAGFNGTALDFNRAKIDRSGALRLYKGSVSVPSGTASGAKIGIIPVRKGAYVQVRGSCLWADALDSSTTITSSVGVTYQPGSASAEAPATFVGTGNTTLRAGGEIALDQVEAGLTYQVLDDGWVTVTLAAAATNTLGNINYNIGVSYDAGALS